MEQRFGRGNGRCGRMNDVGRVMSGSGVGSVFERVR